MYYACSSFSMIVRIVPIKGKLCQYNITDFPQGLSGENPKKILNTKYTILFHFFEPYRIF